MSQIGRAPTHRLGRDGSRIVEPGIVEPSPGLRHPTTDEGWLSIDEAATYAGVSRYVISRLTKSGQLPVFTTPFDRRKRFVHKQDLDRMALARPAHTPFELVWIWMRSIIKHWGVAPLADLQDNAIADLSRDQLFLQALRPDVDRLSIDYEAPASAETKAALRDLVREVVLAMFRGYSNTHAVCTTGPGPDDMAVVPRPALRKRLEQDIAQGKPHPGDWMYAPPPAPPET